MAQENNPMAVLSPPCLRFVMRVKEKFLGHMAIRNWILALGIYMQ